MTTIAILPEGVGEKGKTYRALSGNTQSSGRTAGEALDALTKQLSEDETGLLVIVLNLRPDQFFTERQQQRLSALMDRWRASRDDNAALPAAEQAELESLVEAEIEAAKQRANAVLAGLNK